jgi:hypothetical protein
MKKKMSETNTYDEFRSQLIMLAVTEAPVAAMPVLPAQNPTPYPSYSNAVSTAMFTVCKKCGRPNNNGFQYCTACHQKHKKIGQHGLTLRSQWDGHAATRSAAPQSVFWRWKISIERRENHHEPDTSYLFVVGQVPQ